MDLITGWRKELVVLLVSATAAYGISRVAGGLPGVQEMEPLSGYGIFIVAFLLVCAFLSKILTP
jgi:hypothetical protein